jgi:hypothetical protein
MAAEQRASVPGLPFFALALNIYLKGPTASLRGSKWSIMTHAQPHTFSRRILPKAAG